LLQMEISLLAGNMSSNHLPYHSLIFIYPDSNVRSCLLHALMQIIYYAFKLSPQNCFSIRSCRQEPC
jgi:hypothetical protein